MSQRRDRYPLYAKASPCQACYKAFRLTEALEKKGAELLKAIPKPFLTPHLRFEPDMVAYSQCEYKGLSPASMKAVEASSGDRKPWTGEAARVWSNRRKCPLTPRETAYILLSLGIHRNTSIYLAAGDGSMEIEGLTSIYVKVFTKSKLLSGEDFTRVMEIQRLPWAIMCPSTVMHTWLRISVTWIKWWQLCGLLRGSIKLCF